jgi:hypothetical protein
MASWFSPSRLGRGFRFQLLGHVALFPGAGHLDGDITWEKPRSTWFLWWFYDNLMVILWWSYGDFMVILWWSYGDFMVILWWSYGDFMMILWSSYADLMGLWWFYGDLPDYSNHDEYISIVANKWQEWLEIWDSPWPPTTPSWGWYCLLALPH